MSGFYEDSKRNLIIEGEKGLSQFLSSFESMVLSENPTEFGVLYEMTQYGVKTVYGSKLGLGEEMDKNDKAVLYFIRSETF